MKIRKKITPLLAVFFAILLFSFSFADNPPSAIQRERAFDKDDYFFLIFLGSLEYGQNKITKSTEGVNADENFQEGFYTNGRIAYFLKAKIKGRYLVTSSLDTEKEEEFNQNKIFRNLDPDKYYPVYGDASQRYDEVNSQGKLYVLVNYDKSEAVWGNFHTGITGAELASFSRSLYGGKIYLQSLSSNSYSEPNTKFIVFDAQAHHLASHNEFYATGGSLYYLQHQKVIEGSEKINIEIRDKISNLVISSAPARAGFDYTIDYDRGRILFSQPVNSITSSEILNNQTLLEGNKVFISVDYEYEPENTLDKNTYGARISQNITDNFNLGGTYIKETKENSLYRLGGIDAKLSLGGESYLSCEYAQSKEQQAVNFISYDGGLNFLNMPNNASSGRAGSAKLFLKPNEELSFDSYFNQTAPGFSSASTSIIQGAKKYGFTSHVKISRYSEVLLRYDFQKLGQTATYLTPQSANNSETKTAAIQYQHRFGKWAEYLELSHNASSGGTSSKTRNINAKIEYKANERLGIYLQNQTTIEGDKNNQGILGINWKINDKAFTSIEEIMSSLGTASRFNLHGEVFKDTNLSTSYTIGNQFGSGQNSSLAVGGQSKINQNTSVYSNCILNEGIAGGKNTDISYGIASQVNPKTKIYFENKNQYAKESTNRGIALGANFSPDQIWDLGLSYEQGNFNEQINYGFRQSSAVSAGYNTENLKGLLKGEMRRDSGMQVLRQILVYAKIDWRFAKSFYFTGKCNFSKTENRITNNIAAKVNETNIGIAYRPSSASRFNCLAKYTRLDNISAPWQVNLTDLDNTTNNVYSFEGVYKLTKFIQFAGKYAYKDSMYFGAPINITSRTSLWIARSNYHIDNSTDISLEYRRLYQQLAHDENKGFLVELSKKIYENLWVGTGYNFTNFTDNLLEQNNYSIKGWFIRLIGNY